MAPIPVIYGGLRTLLVDRKPDTTVPAAPTGTGIVLAFAGRGQGRTRSSKAPSTIEEAEVSAGPDRAAGAAYTPRSGTTGEFVDAAAMRSGTASLADEWTITGA
eukprot:7936087-Lingulodinium_polyedra.AAC.1